MKSGIQMLLTLEKLLFQQFFCVVNSLMILYNFSSKSIIYSFSPIRPIHRRSLGYRSLNYKSFSRSNGMVNSLQMMISMMVHQSFVSRNRLVYSIFSNSSHISTNSCLTYFMTYSLGYFRWKTMGPKIILVKFCTHGRILHWNHFMYESILSAISSG